jgi:transposase
LAAVAIEATTGWRRFARELQAHGIEVHLVDPGRASALRSRRCQPKTDRLDARWLALLLARDLLSECEARLAPSGSSSTRTCGVPGRNDHRRRSDHRGRARRHTLAGRGANTGELMRMPPPESR